VIALLSSTKSNHILIFGANLKVAWLSLLPLAIGFGVVQNAYDEISAIEICEKEDIISMDTELLVQAK